MKIIMSDSDKQRAIELFVEHLQKAFIDTDKKHYPQFYDDLQICLANAWPFIKENELEQRLLALLNNVLTLENAGEGEKYDPHYPFKRC